MPITTYSATQQLSNGNGAEGGPGTVLGQSALDKIALFGATPVVQPVNPGNAHTVAAGSTTEAFTTTSYDGGVGTLGYTVGDIVLALKKLGLIAS